MSSIAEEAIIVITGGASGIGKALVEQFIANGSTVISIDKNNANFDNLRKMENNHESVIPITADMAIADEAKKAFEYIIQRYQKIDYLINNAGVFMGGEIRDTPLEDWHAITQNNIFAVMNGTHYGYELMLKQGSGHIINVGSAAGLTPIPAMGIYGSTKYAINGFTLALRNEAKDLGVKVSLVCPTIVNTPLYDTATYHKVRLTKVLAKRESFQKPETTARRIIKGIERNKATIHTATSTRLLSLLYKAAPWLYDAIARRIHAKYRARLRSQ